MLKKITFGQNKRFCFRQLQLITGLLLISKSYRSWSTRFISLELCVGFYIFDSVSFLLKFTFLFSKKHGLFDFKTLIPFKLKILKKPHGALLQNLWFLVAARSLKIQRYLLELDLPKYCSAPLNCSSQKIDLELRKYFTFSQ